MWENGRSGGAGDEYLACFLRAWLSCISFYHFFFLLFTPHSSITTTQSVLVST
jgi:hypothetical protein